VFTLYRFIPVLAGARHGSVVFDVDRVYFICLEPFLALAKDLIVYSLCDVDASVIEDVTFVVSNSG
jgi:hypothetical protein